MPYMGSKKGQAPCKFGANCNRRDTCTFKHPDDISQGTNNMMDEFGNSMP